MIDPRWLAGCGRLPQVSCHDRISGCSLYHAMRPDVDAAEEGVSFHSCRPQQPHAHGYLGWRCRQAHSTAGMGLFTWPASILFSPFQFDSLHGINMHPCTLH